MHAHSLSPLSAIVGGKLSVQLVHAGRCALPVRICVLFLEQGVTARVHGPLKSESLGLRQPGLRLKPKSQTGPECRQREQLQFLEFPEKGACHS